MKLSAAIIAVLSIATYAAQFCHITPDVVKVMDATIDGTKATIALASQPTGPVSVYLDSTNLARIDKCLLTFTPENWQTAQEIIVNSGQMLLNDNTAEVSIGMKFRSVDAAFNDKTDSFKVTREIAASKTCVTNGDPHFSTFDGKVYDYYLEGYHYLVKSDKLVIQTEHYNGFESALLGNGNVAISYMGGGISFTINHDKDESGQDHRKVITKFGDQSGITVIEKGAITSFKLSDGSLIEVTTICSGAKHWYNDITIVLPGHHKKQITGLCGNFDDDVVNDDCSGTIGTQHRVADTDNLVSCGATCVPKTIGGAILGKICIIPTTFPELPVQTTAAPVATTSEVTPVATSSVTADGGYAVPSTTSAAPVETTSEVTPVATSSAPTDGGYAVPSTTSAAPVDTTSEVTPVPTTSTTPDVGYDLPSTTSAAPVATTSEVTPVPTTSTTTDVGYDLPSTTSAAPVETTSEFTAAPTTSTTTDGGYDIPSSTSVDVGYELPTTTPASSSSTKAPTKKTSSSTKVALPTTTTPADNGYGAPPVFEHVPAPCVPDVEIPALPVNLNSTSYVQAKQICSEVFGKLTCGAVSAEFYSRACIIDAVLAGSVANVANNALKQFMAQCNVHVNMLAQSPHKVLVNQAATLQSDYGFSAPTYGKPTDKVGISNGVGQRPIAPPKSNLQCLNGGSPSGYGGCVCVGAWEGLDCSVSTAHCKTFTPTAQEIQAVTAVQAPASVRSDAPTMAAGTFVGLFAAGFVALFV